MDANRIELCSNCHPLITDACLESSFGINETMGKFLIQPTKWYRIVFKFLTIHNLDSMSVLRKLPTNWNACVESSFGINETMGKFLIQPTKWYRIVFKFLVIHKWTSMSVLQNLPTNRNTCAESSFGISETMAKFLIQPTNWYWRMYIYIHLNLLKFSGKITCGKYHTILWI